MHAGIQVIRMIGYLLYILMLYGCNALLLMTQTARGKKEKKKKEPKTMALVP